ncbi:MAG: shikimate dehydrogenase [Akkermansiaceae bacterium]
MSTVYTLENLQAAANQTKPARLAVLGYPVAHSASPQLHQPALDAFEIDAQYIRLEVKPGEIAQALDLLKKYNFIGCNVTVPHKFEAMDCCDEISDQARILGAVNTIVFDEVKILGSNTDGPGIMRAIDEAFGLSLGEIHTLILGAGGGAGQAIATQCAMQKPANLTLANRSIEKIETLADRLRKISPQTKITTLTLNDPAMDFVIRDVDLLLQTSSLGLKENDPSVISETILYPEICVYDTIYEPSETRLLKAAKKKGCRTGNGLSLLLHQGAISFEQWFPGKDPLPIMRRAFGLSS